jgi:5-methylcytosine-specific restriction endonuclease McrA
MAVLNYTLASQAWTKEKVIELIRLKSVDGYCKSTDVGMSCTTSAKRLFGSFKSALEVAGVKIWSDKPKHQHCIVDGCNIAPRSSRAEYCETHYYRLRRNGSTKIKNGSDYINPSLECLYCKAVTGLNKRFCSDSCCTRHSRQSKIVKNCAHCNVEFDPRAFGKSSNRITCSDVCSNLYINEQNKKLRLKSIERYSLRERAAEYKRKSLKRAVAYEEIDRLKVFERDGFICQLCNEPIDRNARWPNKLFATLDHIKPLSKGGSHTYSNVQTAHLKCNCIKGNKDIRKFKDS